jgi:dsRNA-specific ribonuclease
VSGARYSKSVTADLIQGGYYVTIRDNETGNTATGWGRTKEEAEQRAWEHLEEKEGPPPSKR